MSKSGYDITPMTLQQQEEAAKSLSSFQRCVLRQRLFPASMELCLL